MRATFIHAPGDIRVENVPDPEIVNPTDAVVRVVATCVCGSDLWEYRGISPVGTPHPIGHEYVGVVEETGSEVTSVRPGQFVIGSFFASDNACAICRAGYQASCPDGEFINGCQAEYVRVPLADGTLVALDRRPAEEHIPGLLALSDVASTGWYAAVAAGAGPGATVAVVGDGAVGLCGVIAARWLGAERIITMSRHASRRKLALELGATALVAERGDEGAARIRELTGGIGADAVLECVGTPEAMRQALRSARPGGTVGFVGVPHGIRIDGRELFRSQVALRGGPAPVRRFLPGLIEQVLDGRIDPGKVFDLTLPLDHAAEGYRAMDERRAVKTLLYP
ncbi:IMP dehydrogenase [Streptomyces eurocidicus]|uniref:IMP dehydrogenase n=1 Tax=Streptomyces eurocidicus TaxID=66423 RepID=A0A2N8NUU5_STREU|nr:zinc-dependent alcohol dehydrogenase family protein [Streptomyces eurocidicus]MBB5121238.1 threonine dehydrogenase-like Zn-dependent dehydrogenase [Streptomyces eurocidicus]MBF6055847.1 zinc-binding dehydrogenase [Streptomyces eurocidicus]PNE32546.1 IMP dehydrogenase [Streptomyces eurocidicus]